MFATTGIGKGPLSGTRIPRRSDKATYRGGMLFCMLLGEVYCSCIAKCLSKSNSRELQKAYYHRPVETQMFVVRDLGVQRRLAL